MLSCRPLGESGLHVRIWRAAAQLRAHIRIHQPARSHALNLHVPGAAPVQPEHQIIGISEGEALQKLQ
jgi:hypothetical protein